MLSGLSASGQSGDVAVEPIAGIEEDADHLRLEQVNCLHVGIRRRAVGENDVEAVAGAHVVGGPISSGCSNSDDPL